MVTVAPDIHIVESPSDLNVYTSTNDDGTAKDAAENVCCAGNPTSKKACCSGARCGVGEGGSSIDTLEKTKDIAKTDGTVCCPKAHEKKEHADVSHVRDLDLNMWAGSFKIYAVKP